MKPAKPKEKIIGAYENAVILRVFGWLVIVAGVVSAVIVSGGPGHALTTTVLAVSFACALVLMLLAIRCPVCDGLRTPEHLEAGIFIMKTGGFRCDACNMSGRQLREYIDLLQRGVDIDGDVLAGLNRRDL